MSQHHFSWGKPAFVECDYESLDNSEFYAEYVYQQPTYQADVDFGEAIDSAKAISVRRSVEVISREQRKGTASACPVATSQNPPCFNRWRSQLEATTKTALVS
ncbi:MAG: hypothetical protein ACFB8W_00925 [Elainellaceae cyanobacterium]